MRLWYFPYELFPTKALNRTFVEPRFGFLLKMQTDEFESGYADCHPWSSFGDGNVQLLLKRLRERSLTPLLKRSLFFAKIDGRAREKKQSLFEKDLKIKSHYTTVSIDDVDRKNIDMILEKGFTTIKVKLGRDIEREVGICNSFPKSLVQSLRWRLDFNGRGGEKFLSQLKPSFLPQIDFIEDPEKYDEERWVQLERDFSVPIAYDQPAGTFENLPDSRIRVIKPARQNKLAREHDVITNSMDHPVGQSFALLQAQKSLSRFSSQTTDYGLKTDHLFKKDPFFEEVTSDSCFSKYSDGYGIGFNDLLTGLTWLSL